MPRPANITIGSCDCYIKGCDEVAHIRRTAGKGVRNKLYLYCPTHKVVSIAGEGFQAYIREKGEFDVELDPGESATGSETEAQPKRAPAKAQPTERVSNAPGRGWNNWDLDDL